MRPYSFLWVLLEILVQSNIEYFTFLALRNFQTPFSFNIESKLLQVLVILMFFLVTFTAFCSYSLYYYDYRKLAKYFLFNLFRFKSSYVLMTIMYGVRPLLKGTLHTLPFSHWEIQIWSLLGVELLMQVIILAFEFKCDSHRSKPLFMMNTLYYWSLILLNILLLMKYKYFEGNNKYEEFLEELITIVVYVMVSLLALQVVWEYCPIGWLANKLSEEGMMIKRIMEMKEWIVRGFSKTKRTKKRMKKRIIKKGRGRMKIKGKNLKRLDRNIIKMMRKQKSKK